MSAFDTQVRLRAFAFLEEQQKIYDETLPRSVLEKGFDFEGTRVPLLGPQGIFKTALLDLPLSFTTVPIVEGKPRPYEDEVDQDGLIRYRYRGTDPQHRDNIGLERACSGTFR
jgi:putative restriction endonuclease